MSLTNAITEIRTRLNGLGLTEDPDARERSLATSSKGQADGVYKLKISSLGNPWPEATTNANAWYCQMELECSTLMTNDQVEADLSAEARGRAIRENLHYTPLTNGMIFDFQEPQPIPVTNNPRLRLWAWRFKLRYTE